MVIKVCTVCGILKLCSKVFEIVFLKALQFMTSLNNKSVVVGLWSGADCLLFIVCVNLFVQYVICRLLVVYCGFKNSVYQVDRQILVHLYAKLGGLSQIC